MTNVTYTGMRFETDKDGLEKVLKLWRNPEKTYTQNSIELDVSKGSTDVHQVSISMKDNDQKAYQGLEEQLKENNVLIHNLKFI